MPARRVLALATAVVLAAAGCNGGGDGGDQAIQVMLVAELDARPHAAAGAQAAAQALNARGGIGGRELVVLPCDTEGRADQARACAEEAVDRGMVATVGSFTDQGAAVVPVLEEAGIAQVGVFPVSGPDFDSPVSFPVVGGGPTVLGGLATVLADQGARRVFVVHPAGQAGEAAATLVRIGLRNRGLDPVGTAAVAPDAADLGPVLAQVTTAAADGVAVALPPEPAARLVQAARDAGLGARLAADPSAAAEGMLTPSLYRVPPAGTPGGTRFAEELRAFDPDVPVDDATVNGWLAVQLLAEVAGRLDAVDRHRLFRAMDRVSALDLGGLVPPYSTTEVFGLAGFSRLYNRTVVYAEVRDGRLHELDGRFVDPWARLSSPELTSP